MCRVKMVCVNKFLTLIYLLKIKQKYVLYAFFQFVKCVIQNESLWTLPHIYFRLFEIYEFTIVTIIEAEIYTCKSKI